MNNDQIKAFVDQTVEIQELINTIKDLTAELEEYRFIAEKVGAEKAVSEKEKWEELADRLIVYAKDYVYPIDPFANHRDYKVASNVIEQYNNLKKEFTDGNG